MGRKTNSPNSNQQCKVVFVYYWWSFQQTKSYLRNKCINVLNHSHLIMRNIDRRSPKRRVCSFRNCRQTGCSSIMDSSIVIDFCVGRAWSRIFTHCISYINITGKLNHWEYPNNWEYFNHVLFASYDLQVILYQDPFNKKTTYSLPKKIISIW